jgi:hypothetical protein
LGLEETVVAKSSIIPESIKARLQSSPIYLQTAKLSLILPMAFVPIPPVLWVVQRTITPESPAVDLSSLPWVSPALVVFSLLTSMAVAILVPRILNAQVDRWLDQPQSLPSMLHNTTHPVGHGIHPGIQTMIVGLAILEAPLLISLAAHFLAKTDPTVLEGACLFSYAGLYVILMNCRPAILESTLAKLHQAESDQGPGEPSR